MAKNQEASQQSGLSKPGKRAAGQQSLPTVTQAANRTLKQKMVRGGLFSLAIILLLILLAGGIFYGLASMKIVDPEEQAQKMGWQDNSLVKAAIEKMRPQQQAQIVVRPDKDEPATVQPQQAGATAQPSALSSPMAVTSNAKVAPIDTTERDRLEKQRQQEEKKRVSKLARLYEGMKPSEAVPIMEQLDDDTIVAVLNRMEEENAAKVLAAFDSARAASLSTAMLRNRPNQILIPRQN